MRPSSRLRWFGHSLAAFGAALVVTVEAASIGEFSESRDIGIPKLAGSSSYDEGSQSYALTAAGQNMWAARDEFHSLWEKLKGDFILQARVEFVGKGVDPHRKLGSMIRSRLVPDPSYADATMHGDGLTALQFCRTNGAITEQVKSAATAPDFLQFERRGGDYIFSAARLGDPPVVCRTNLYLADEVFVGLFLCSHRSNVVEKAVFKDVRIIRPVKTGLVPGQGSRHSPPDGQDPAFLSFPPGDPANENPPDRQVNLRLTPAAGDLPIPSEPCRSSVVAAKGSRLGLIPGQ